VSSPGLAIIYGIISAIMLVVLGWFLAPLYLRTKINTLPEYFEKRFIRTCRYFLSALYIFYNIFIRLMIILVAGNIFINTVTGADAYSSLLFFLIITGIYIIIGGLRAEIYVNVVRRVKNWCWDFIWAISRD
jgi:SSS family solute:Na+ symporter